MDVNKTLPTRIKVDVEQACLGLLPTPTKEISNDGSVISSQREISMREISKQLGFSVGTGHRTLSSHIFHLAAGIGMK